MEKEEKRRMVEEAREKRALAIANAPRRRSGRLSVSFLHVLLSFWGEGVGETGYEMRSIII